MPTSIRFLRYIRIFYSVQTNCDTKFWIASDILSNLNSKKKLCFKTTSYCWNFHKIFLAFEMYNNIILKQTWWYLDWLSIHTPSTKGNMTTGPYPVRIRKGVGESRRHPSTETATEKKLNTIRNNEFSLKKHNHSFSSIRWYT